MQFIICSLFGTDSRWGRNNRAISDFNVLLPYFIGWNLFSFITANKLSLSISLTLKETVTPSTKFCQHEVHVLRLAHVKYNPCNNFIVTWNNFIVTCNNFIFTLIYSFLTIKWASLYLPYLVPNGLRSIIPLRYRAETHITARPTSYVYYMHRTNLKSPWTFGRM